MLMEILSPPAHRISSNKHNEKFINRTEQKLNVKGILEDASPLFDN